MALKPQRYEQLEQAFHGVMSPRALQRWVQSAELLSVPAGSLITRQFHRGERVYLLLDGLVEHYIQLEQGRTALRVGTMQEACSPIGWSALMGTQRYATTSRTRRPSRLLAWSMADWQTLCECEPEQGWRWLAQVAQRALPLLYDSLALQRTGSALNGRSLAGSGPELAHSEQARLEHGVDPVPAQAQILQAAGLSEEDGPVMAALLEAAHWLDLGAGETVFHPDKPVTDWYILARGGVGIHVGERGGVPGAEAGASPSGAPHYTLFTPGHSLTPPPAGGTVAAPHGARATALTATRLLVVPGEASARIFAAHPEAGVRLIRQVLAQLNESLRSVRTHLVAASFDQDDVAVRTLLQQCAAQLRVASPLHAVPHLLTSRLTQDAALACLERVRNDGDALERSIATLSLDLLDGVAREQRFHAALKSIYDEVAGAPPGVKPATLRRHCDAGFLAAFSRLRHIIQGEEHLPPVRPGGPGHIFILNHLVSHPYHALPNGFEFALDSHFVSAMLLFRHYGDGGLRVVRWSRDDEFAHQSFYERLGYLYVRTPESGNTDAEAAEKLRKAFFEQAADWLRGGGHLVICPEGKSHWAYQSPGGFRSGAFRLAASLDPEPWVVPVAVANFDKRLKQHALAAVIKPPLRVSERVVADDEPAMQAFMAGLREAYRGYIAEARRLARDAQAQG